MRLPDGAEYCAACCERMATDAFEMETGEPFVKWIEKHPELVMAHQPMELAVRRMGFLFPLACAVLGLGLAVFGTLRLLNPPPEDTAAVPVSPAPSAGRTPKKLPPPSGKGYLAAGLAAMLLFGWLVLRQGKGYLRAAGFRLTLRDGVFHLKHRDREESFPVGDVTQACVVRPGTVGAREGALGLSDGRMLTLDTCLSDLHALGVVMDLRFREDFPPSLEERDRERRERLRKIRGLS
ncbi:MAG: hypothetical protein L6R28_11205 [Planctomycetes bacterium]|nr:hypothetical protein [Planctomycetota bacterium]